jgi:alpha-methylacyl-CoA racemase
MSVTAFPVLERFRIVSLAINLPGPLAAARLKAMGATVQKIEPPDGDPLEQAAPAWYRHLHEGIEIHRLDLKKAAACNLVDTFLARADLLITASRPSSLHRLGLGWEVLHERFPLLSQVAIIGHSSPDEELPGHDLLYQAEQGLIEPPAMPRTCIADLAGALEAVIATLQLLVGRASEEPGRCIHVSLADAAASFAEPRRQGLTKPDGILGGGIAGYGLYRTAKGWIAIGALEPHFRDALVANLAVERLHRQELQRIFLTRTADDWVAWARERDLPVAKVVD